MKCDSTQTIIHFCKNLGELTEIIKHENFISYKTLPDFTQDASPTTVPINLVKAESSGLRLFTPRHEKHQTVEVKGLGEGINPKSTELLSFDQVLLFLYYFWIEEWKRTEIRTKLIHVLFHKQRELFNEGTW